MNKQVLYILKANDAIKIGITNNLNSRISSIQTGNPIKIIKYLTLISDCRKTIQLIEQTLHVRFKAYRLNGEWFNYHKDIDGHILRVLTEYPNVQLDFYNNNQIPVESTVDKIKPTVTKTLVSLKVERQPQLNKNQEYNNNLYPPKKSVAFKYKDSRLIENVVIDWYLDIRRIKKNGKYVLKLRVYFKGKTKYFAMSNHEYTIEEFYEIWKAENIKTANKELNQHFKSKLERFRQLRFLLDKFSFEAYEKLLLEKYDNL